MPLSPEEAYEAIKDLESKIDEVLEILTAHRIETARLDERTKTSARGHGGAAGLLGGLIGGFLSGFLKGWAGSGGPLGPHV